MHLSRVSKLRMKKASYVTLYAVVVVVVLLFEAPLMAKAVTCSPLELNSCITAITSPVRNYRLSQKFKLLGYDELNHLTNILIFPLTCGLRLPLNE
jgi:hypothetical protein